MLLFYVRHGNPTYDPDELTPLGKRQAEAVAKRLSMFGLDKIYASTSTRAQETAMPTCEITQKKMELLDFCNEAHAWNDFTVTENNKRTWCFNSQSVIEEFCSKRVSDLGFSWYESPAFDKYNFKNGMDRIYDATDDFMRGLGYEHIREQGRYKILNNNKDRVALFAHQGFGLAFLSVLLDIPYPLVTLHFDMCHTGMTVIDFCSYGEYAIPKVLTLSNDSHLYKDGLPTYYNNYLRF